MNHASAAPPRMKIGVRRVDMMLAQFWCAQPELKCELATCLAPTNVAPLGGSTQGKFFTGAVAVHSTAHSMEVLECDRSTNGAVGWMSTKRQWQLAGLHRRALRLAPSGP